MTSTPPAWTPGLYRIYRGDSIGMTAWSNLAGAARFRFRVIYDDPNKGEDLFEGTVNASGTWSVNGDSSFAGGQGTVLLARGDGYVISGIVTESGTSFKRGQCFVQCGVNAGGPGGPTRQILIQGWLTDFNAPSLGQIYEFGFDATWVFQGTIAEDATAGTHVCTLTVSPGAGNELQVIGGEIQVGNTATAQFARAAITDGTTHEIIPLFNPNNGSGTTALLFYPFPQNGSSVATNTLASTVGPSGGFYVSGTEALVLTVQTAAVSVTQVFAVQCRIKGAMPTATLADTVGAPVLTTNVSAIFG